MATAALISEAEYLATSYRPDCELVDGQLIGRNVGEYDHSKLQGILIIWFGIRQDEWNIEVLPEQRIRVAPGRFRIPDICVISRGQRPEAVFTEPPLLCIEVLSKDDTLRSMQERIDDYTAFGIPNIWVLDPVGRQAWVCNTGEFRKPEGGVLRAEPFIHIPLTDLFAKLG